MKTETPTLYSQPLIEDIQGCKIHGQLLELEKTQKHEVAGIIIEIITFKWSQTTLELFGAMDPKDVEDCKHFFNKLVKVLESLTHGHVGDFMKETIPEIETENGISCSPALGVSLTHFTVIMHYTPMTPVEWQMRKTLFEEKQRRRAEEGPSLGDMLSMLFKMGGEGPIGEA